MTTKRESILAAIETILEGVPGVASGAVYRSRVSALSRQESPAIVIEPVDDVPEYDNLTFMKWTLYVRISVIVRGAIPDQLADPIVENIYSLLMADRNLGGKTFDILPAGTYFDMINGDQPIGVIENRFTITYRTLASDLTQ